MHNTGNRKCSYQLCLCTKCPGTVRVKRVRVQLRETTVTMTGPGYMQYRDALQAKAWAEVAS